MVHPAEDSLFLFVAVPLIHTTIKAVLCCRYSLVSWQQVLNYSPKKGVKLSIRFPCSFECVFFLGCIFPAVLGITALVTLVYKSRGKILSTRIPSRTAVHPTAHCAQIHFHHRGHIKHG